MKIVTPEKPKRIIDKKNDNVFGIYFGDYKSLEEFQEKSGMSGKYTVEYQHHRWDAIGRVEAGGQIMDVCIPLCLVNYHQEVSGAHIEFNLEEVGEALQKAADTAGEKFEELQDTEFYKALEEFGITQWVLTPWGTNHMHPAGVNGFSGTDLRAQVDHPGVCYPLSEGKNIASFSGMMQHKEDHAQQIIMQYRLFSEAENGDKVYYHGRCLGLIRGYETPEPEAPVIPEPGPIDQIFGTKPTPPPPPPKPKERKSYILKDRLSIGEANEIAGELLALWEKCDFQTDTSHILKSNIVRGRGKLLGANTTSFYNGGGAWGGSTGKYQSGRKNGLDEINEGLFKDLEKTAGKKSTDPTYVEAVQYLEKKGYQVDELRSSFTYRELIDAYWEERLDEAAAEANMAAEPDEEEIGTNLMTREEMTQMLEADKIVTSATLRMMTLDKLEETFSEAYGLIGG